MSRRKEQDEKGPLGWREEPTSFQKGKLAPFKELEMRGLTVSGARPDIYLIHLYTMEQKGNVYIVLYVAQLENVI